MEIKANGKRKKGIEANGKRKKHKGEWQKHPKKKIYKIEMKGENVVDVGVFFSKDRISIKEF